jgi:hypothetical protein
MGVVSALRWHAPPDLDRDRGRLDHRPDHVGHVAHDDFRPQRQPIHLLAGVHRSDRDAQPDLPDRVPELPVEDEPLEAEPVDATIEDPLAQCLRILVGPQHQTGPSSVRDRRLTTRMKKLITSILLAQPRPRSDGRPPPFAAPARCRRTP